MDIKILVQEFYDYSLFFKGYSKDTVRRYKYVLDMYCRKEDIKQLSDVTEANLRNLFFVGRTQRNWSTNTYVCFYKTFIVFFKWCITKGYLDHNPMDGIDKPRIEQKLPIKITKQESLRLLEVVYNYPHLSRFLRCRNHAMFATFIFAGLRKSELLNLMYGDVDIENLSIFVRKGKGSKDRVIPMSPSLAQSLRCYITERKRLNRTCPEFWVSNHYDGPFTVNGLHWLVKNLRRDTKMKFSVHKLRHTFATLMLEGGCDIYSLSKMMGHSDIKTTTIYLSASVEHLRNQMKKHPMNNLV